MLIVRTIVHEQQHPRGGEAIDEAVENRLGFRVDPVQVLDDQAERLRQARGQEHPPDGVVRSPPALPRIHIAERIVVRQHPQQVQNRRAHRMRIGVGRHRRRDALSHLGRRVEVLDVTQAPEQLDEREVGRVRHVRRPTGGENEPALKGLDGLVYKARFPDAGLAEDADDLPVPLLGE
jgi:hypothetical protein